VREEVFGVNCELKERRDLRRFLGEERVVTFSFFAG
jgi:hypothetical protein